MKKTVSLPQQGSCALSGEKPPYIPQLIRIEKVPASLIQDSSSLQTKLISVFNLTEDIADIVNVHLDKITGYTSEQQNTIYSLYDTICSRELESHAKTELLEIMKSLTCFIGLKNPLMLFAGYITYPTQTTAPFERWLNKQVVNYINTVATKIVADINAHVFFNAPDPQSTHQQEPVFRYLDQTYNLYQGSYPADIHNSLTPSATTFIKESIKRLNDASSTGGILTLDTWVTEIMEQLTYSNATLCCADYIFQLGQEKDINPALKKILDDLTDQILEMTIEENPYIYEEEDKYKPTPELLKLLLKNRLLEGTLNSSTAEDNSSANEPQRPNPFCLRNGITETFIHAAHGTKVEIKDAIQTDISGWDAQEKELFLHIVISRFKDDIAFLKELDTQSKRAFDGSGIYGHTPVFIAAQNGHTEVLKVLFTLGADVNTPNNTGWTPVLAAAENGHTEALKVLVAHGADVTTPNNTGWTPVLAAAENGHTEALKVLVALGADVNTPPNTGWTPVLAAAENGHTEALPVLVEGGADVTTPNNNGVTPVFIAAQNGQLEALTVLVAHGADVNTKSSDGLSLLDTATHHGHADTVRVLKELGAQKKSSGCVIS